MKPLLLHSAVDQLAAYLRERIREGALGGEMPGVAQLARRLGVGTKTVVAALEILKNEGLLEAAGERKRNRIMGRSKNRQAGLRVRMLLYEPSDLHDEHMVKVAFQLEERGHKVSYAEKTLSELNFDVKRVARMVEKNDGDAWVVRSGSRPVLEWFAAQDVPAFALFGRQSRLEMASFATLKSPALAKALKRLVDLGHRRVVLLAREERRKPTLGLFEQRYMDELKRLGIEVGSYNLPDWENDSQSFHRCLDSLFQFTPPTALLLTEPALFFATQQHLLMRGLTVPRDVSLMSLDDHPAFEWFVPEVSLLRTDTLRCVARVVQWADNVAAGKKDLRETLVESDFIEGGTIGPAR